MDLMEKHKQLKEMNPTKGSYDNEGELIDEFLSRCDCNYCDGKSHSGTVFGFGCGILHWWVSHNCDLIKTPTP